VPIFIGRGAPTTLRRDLDCLPANKKRSRRLAEHLTRMDLIVVNELGYLHFAQAGGQFLLRISFPASSATPR
jgi:hypothetical protein